MIVHLRDSIQRTALHKAILNNQVRSKPFVKREATIVSFEITQAVIHSKQVEAARHLLENGADLEAQTVKGETPIHLAVMRGNTEMIFLLLVDFKAKFELLFYCNRTDFSLFTLSSSTQNQCVYF